MAINFPDPSESPWYNDPSTGGNGVTYEYTPQGYWTAVSVAGNNAIDIGTGDGRYVNVSGDTMTGDLIVDANVGIGVSDPPYVKLQVENGTTAGSYQLGRFLSYNGTNSKYLDFWINNSEDNPVVTLNASKGAGSSPSLSFQIASSDKVRIDSSGNVGIGTLTPGSIVDVYAGVLGQDLDDELQLTTLRNSNGNGNALRFYDRRHTAGNGWSGTATRIQRRIDSTNQGYIEFGTENGIVGGSYDVSIGSTDGEIARFTREQQLLVNTTTSIPVGAYTKGLLQVKQNNSSTQAGLSVVAEGSAGTTYPRILLSRANASATSVIDNSALGVIQYAGLDSDGNYIPAATIQSDVDGNPGANDMPGRLTFRTTSVGDSVPTERMRIDSDGNVGIETTNPRLRLDVGGVSAGGLAGLDAYVAYFGLPQSNAAWGGVIAGAGINGNTPFLAASKLSGGTALPLTFMTDATERARIDSRGRLLVGTSVYRSVGDSYEPQSQVFVEGASISHYQVFVGVTNRDDAQGPLINLAKTRSDSVGGVVSVEDGDLLGQLRFCGANGVDLSAAGAFITAAVDDTPSETSMPGRLIFSTSSEGSTVPSERMRIDRTGRLLVSTSIPIPSGNNPSGNKLCLEGSLTISRNSDNNIANYIEFIKNRSGGASVESNDNLGQILFEGSDGTNPIKAASIEGRVDGTPGTDDMPGRLVFSTTADGASNPTERMRITNNGEIRINTGGGQVNVGVGTTDGITIYGTLNPAAGVIQTSTDGGPAMYLRRRTSDGTIIAFNRDTTNVGSISVTTTSTSYNETSDYRLKKNVVDISDGIARLKQLKPRRFNFRIEPDTTVDGFIAHELQEVVPQAVTGTKDQVDREGSPVMQGVDKSKLVPLLTAALQEAVAKIESLEQRLSAGGL